MADHDHAVSTPTKDSFSRESLKSIASRTWTSRFGWFVIGFASLLWLLVRSGPKPSRTAYPCQRMAAANAAVWLSMFFVPIFGIWRHRRYGMAAIGIVLTAVTTAVLILVVFLSRAPALEPSQSLPGIVDIDAAGILSPLPLVINPVGRRGSDISDIYVVRETNGADDGFPRLLSMMADDGMPFYQLKSGGSPAGIIASDDVVIIKVNSQWDSRGGTNVDLVRSIIQALIDHPEGFRGEIIIADNGQSQYGSSGRGGSLDWNRNNGLDQSVSMADVTGEFASDHRVSTYRWDAITTSRVEEYSAGDEREGYVVAETPAERTGIIVSYPKFETLYGTKISFAQGVWNEDSGTYDTDRLKVINIPVLKSHAIYGVTGAVKHYMGVVSDKLTRHNAHRSVGSGGMGSQMAKTRVPDLNIIDAIWVNARPGRGPSTSYEDADYTGIIAAGRDPAALDAWAATEILMQTAAIKGYRGAERMDPADRRPGTFGHWLDLSAEELRRSGLKANTDIEKIRVVVSDRETPNS